MICIVRQIQEKYIEQNIELYAVFTDLKKEDSTLSNNGLWISLDKSEWPTKFINIRHFHKNMTGQLSSDGGLSKPLPILNGMKQGCVLGLVFSGLSFTDIVNYTTDNPQKSIYIRYRINGKVPKAYFNNKSS